MFSMQEFDDAIRDSELVPDANTTGATKIAETECPA